MKKNLKEFIINETEDFDELIKAGNASYIYYAGLSWKQFDYEKGLDALIKASIKSEEAGYIYDAGKDWKQFNYKKGLKFLRDNSEYYYRIALKDWPKGVKETKAKIKRLERDSKELPTKPLKLKEAVKDFDELIKTGDAGQIYNAGRYWGYFDYEKGLDALIKVDNNAVWIYYAGKVWKQFDYKKGLDALIKAGEPDYLHQAGAGWKQFDYEKGLDALIKIGSANPIYNAGIFWKHFDYEKGLDALIKIGKVQYIYDAGAKWKQFNYEKGSDALIKIGDARYIYNAGNNWKQFNHKKAISFLRSKSNKHYRLALRDWPKGVEQSKAKIKRLEKYSKKLPTKPLKLKEAKEDFDALIKGSDALGIYYAGVGWKQFNYEKGLDALIKAGEADYIYHAGARWKKFDYEKGADALIKIGDAHGIYLAGCFWKQFNYEKAFKFLKSRSKKYYEAALKHWPKGVKETKAEIERLKRTSKELPTKPLKLKEATEDFDILIKSGDAGDIYVAGRYWKQFDYKKGLDALIKIGDVSYMCYAGKYWKQFDYKKGFDALIKIGDNAEGIEWAGTHWKQFDYEKGLNALIRLGDGARNIYFAGRYWKQFDYEKALNFLKNKSEKYYKKALKDWPKGVKETKAEIERLKKTSKKLPTKKLKLKEENEEELINKIANLIVKHSTKNVRGKTLISFGKFFKELMTFPNSNKELKSTLTNPRMLAKVDKELSLNWEEIKSIKTFFTAASLSKMFPMDVKDTKAKIKRLKRGSKELSTKPLRLKEATEDFDKLIRIGRASYIYNAGLDWKEFDYKKGLDALIKTGNSQYLRAAGAGWKQFDYEKGLDALIKAGIKSEYAGYVYDAGIYWKQFDYEKALKFLKSKSKDYYKRALKDWPKGVKASKAEIERLKKTSKELPTKPLRLKETTEDFDELIKGSNARKIYDAGLNWKQFDYEKGSDALIKAGNSRLIYIAGKEWKQFDYKKGLDALIKIGDVAGVYDAGLNWKQFNYEKALDYLKRKSKAWYGAALEDWPKGVEWSKAKIKRLKKTSKELPTKPLRLKEATEDFDELIKTGNATQIYRAGTYWKEFDYEKALDALIKIGEAGEIYDAGMNWKQFDYEKGLDGLIKIGDAYDIYFAGVNWEQFDYKKGLDFLKNNARGRGHYRAALKDWPKGVEGAKAEIERLKRDSKELPTKPLRLKEATEDFDRLIKIGNAAQIYRAGLGWKQFDYKKGLDALIEIGAASWIVSAGNFWKQFDYRKGSNALIEIGIEMYIYLAGRDWKEFDYEKGFKFLKGKSEDYYRKALRDWPKGVKRSKAEIERLKKTSKELPTKPLRLKEATKGPKYALKPPLSLIRKINASIELEDNSEAVKILKEIKGILIGKYPSVEAMRNSAEGLKKKAALLEEYIYESKRFNRIAISIAVLLNLFVGKGVYDVVKDANYYKYKASKEAPVVLTIDVKENEWTELETAIDKYFNSLVKDNLENKQELVRVLNKYNISFSSLPPHLVAELSRGRITIDTSKAKTPTHLKGILRHEMVHREAYGKRGIFYHTIANLTRNYHNRVHEIGAFHKELKYLLSKGDRYIFGKVLDVTDKRLLRNIIKYFPDNDEVVKEIEKYFK